MFDPKQYEERAALTMLNGRIIMAWTSHCDIDPYTGWIMAYDANTLAQSSVLNITPNGSRGGFWMAGAGPAVDPQGNLYLLDGNGTFDTTLTGAGFPSQGNFGNAFLKIATSSGLAVADYFATFDTVAATNADRDLGSGGTLVLPDLVDGAGQTRHLAVGAGKDGHIYVVDRDAMGKWNASSNQSYQDISGALGGSVFSMPAYFNNTVYYGAAGGTLKAFAITNARLASSRELGNRTLVRVSGDHSGHLGIRQREWDCLGGRKLESRCPARLRCAGSDAGALQLEPGGRWPRPVRARQQVHHADDRQRPGVRRHGERCRGIRPSCDRASAGPDWLEDRSLAVS